MRDLKNKELVIFDLETTGLDPKEGDRICEIAAIKFKNDNLVGSFNSLVDPCRPLSPAAFAVNHIDEKMLVGAPRAGEILPKFMDFLSGSYVASYNIRFDLNFLQSELKLLNQNLDPGLMFFDVLTLARRTLLNIPSYSLANVARGLGIPTIQVHRAYSDVELTWQVYNSLVSILKERGIKQFKEIYTICGFNAELLAQANEQKIAFILRAIDFHFDISIRYFSKNVAEVTERKVSPEEIYEENGKKYLVGYCHLRKSERNFAIDSILHLNVEE